MSNFVIHLVGSIAFRNAADVFKRVGSVLLRMLAVSFAKRFRKLPDIPTIAETYPGLIIVGCFTPVGPAGILAEIMQRLNREVDKIVKDSEFVERIAGSASARATL
jgi:tripartite-type tricarboxylate transporter receptor subunit TctC